MTTESEVPPSSARPSSPPTAPQHRWAAIGCGFVTGGLAGCALACALWLIAQYAFDDPVSTRLLSAHQLGFWISIALLLPSSGGLVTLTRRALMTTSGQRQHGALLLILLLLVALVLGLVAGFGGVVGLESVNDAGLI